MKNYRTKTNAHDLIFMMQRREFIKSSCNACLLAGSGMLLSSLAGCSENYQVVKTEVMNDQLQIPVSGFAKSSLLFVRPKGWLYDIAVQRKTDSVYEAVLLQCTHQNNQLLPDGGSYLCSLHGSRFDKAGRVIKGPAEQPLKMYPVSVEREFLIIHLKQS